MQHPFSDSRQQETSMSGLSAVSVQRKSDWSRWHSHLIRLLPILAVYIFLAFYGIERQSLWGDEYNSVWRITASRYPIWKDGHGFLYFAVLYLWTQLGTSELIL